VERLRTLVRKYPLAAGAVAVGIAALIGVGVYQATSARPQPAATPAATAPAASGPSAPATGAAPRAGAPAPQAPGAPAPAGAPSTAALAPAGRPDPFVPLVQPQPPGGGASGAAAPRPALPPIPPLYPGGGLPLPPGVAPSRLPPGAPAPAPVPAIPQYRLVGILNDSSGLAIVEGEKSSYIVGVGDFIGPDLRVVRIDALNGAVELSGSGQHIELTLGGGKAQ